MSPFSQRLAATLALAALATLTSLPVLAAAPNDSTWIGLAAPAVRIGSPIFALAVSPTDSKVVLVGSSDGGVYRSADGGGTWKQVRRDPAHQVLALAFDPYQPALVLEGAKGGVWRSEDAGQTWSPQAGLGGASARAFAFTRSLLAAGTDRGVFIARGSDEWLPAGLGDVSVDALAVLAPDDPARLVAGGDRDQPGVALPLYASPDAGNTWTPVNAQGRGGSMVATLTAGAAQRGIRPLLMGTNAGLYVSIDNGGSWNGPLSGGGTLPASDFNQAGFVKDRFDRFYVGSDGGGSDQGGLWYSGDGGAHFTSLQPPLPEVTALAVSNDDPPTLYVATFRPSDHAVFLWSYHDTGAAPRGPLTALPAGSSAQHGGRSAPRAATTQSWPFSVLGRPEAPFFGIGVAAAVALVFTLVAYVRRGRRRRA